MASASYLEHSLFWGIPLQCLHPFRAGSQTFCCLRHRQFKSLVKVLSGTLLWLAVQSPKEGVLPFQTFRNLKWVLHRINEITISLKKYKIVLLNTAIKLSCVDWYNKTKEWYYFNFRLALLSARCPRQDFQKFLARRLYRLLARCVPHCVQAGICLLTNPDSHHIPAPCSSRIPLPSSPGWYQGFWETNKNRMPPPPPAPRKCYGQQIKASTESSWIGPGHDDGVIGVIASDVPDRLPGGHHSPHLCTRTFLYPACTLHSSLKGMVTSKFLRCPSGLPSPGLTDRPPLSLHCVSCALSQVVRHTTSQRILELWPSSDGRRMCHYFFTLVILPLETQAV